MNATLKAKAKASPYPSVLWLVPGHLLGAAMPYLLMADLEFTLFFVAGAGFLEKGERSLLALSTAPLRFGH